VVFRHLSKPSASGPKPRDLSRVRASWKVWFLRNSELILSTAGAGFGGSADSLLDGTGAKDVVLDEGQLMVALELGLKEMQAGGRACVRVSE
ncbi:unnamed protein product, partial [Polarella glacialis]